MSELSAKPEARDMELASTRSQRLGRIYFSPAGF